MYDVPTILFCLATIGLVLAFCCGLAFLLVPASFRLVALRLDRWISSAPLLDTLDRPRYLERSVYRHHKIAGFLIVLGAIYTLIWLSSLHEHQVALLLPVTMAAGLRREIVEMGVPVIAASNLLALAVGIVIYFRPSLLKRSETVANRWWSLVRVLRPLDTPHGEVNRWLWSHPRLVGLGMMLAVVYFLGIISSFYYRW